MTLNSWNCLECEKQGEHFFISTTLGNEFKRMVEEHTALHFKAKQKGVKSKIKGRI